MGRCKNSEDHLVQQELSTLRATTKGMNRVDDLRKALEQMGANAEDVAVTLRAADVQGVRNAVRFLNPIVRYIQNELRFDNLNADVTTGNTFRIHGVEIQEVILPQAVMDFIDAFNREAYPDLELPPS